MDNPLYDAERGGRRGRGEGRVEVERERRGEVEVEEGGIWFSHSV